MNFDLPYRDADWGVTLCSILHIAPLGSRRVFNESNKELHRPYKVTTIFPKPIIQFINPKTYGYEQIIEVINYHNPIQFDMHYTSENKELYKILNEFDCKIEKAETEFNITEYLIKDLNKFDEILKFESDCYLSSSDIKLFNSEWKTNMTFEKINSELWDFNIELDIDSDETYLKKVQELVTRNLIFETTE